MKRLARPFLALAAIAAAGGLLSCLMDQPLARPADAYDARADLGGDSLTRFDTVEVWLKDAEDPERGVLLWKGPLATPESLGVRLGGGRDQVYFIYGYKRDKAGACFEARKPRDRELTLLKDSCDLGNPGPPDIPPKDTLPKDSIPKDSIPKEPERPRPRFEAGSLELADSLPARVIVRDLGASQVVIRATPDWLQAEWVGTGGSESAGSVRDSVLRVQGRTADLEAGVHMGTILLESNGVAQDALPVRLTVSQRYARGSVSDWISDAPQGGIRVDLEDGAYAITGADGKYAIPVPAGKTRVPARFSAAGRIGALDTVPVSADAKAGTATRLPSAAAFGAVDLSDERQIDGIAAVAGYGIVVSTPYNQAGQISLVRLDGPRPAFLKSILLGNEHGDPEYPDYFEAGDLVADSDAVYIAYPEADRIERFGNWRGVPERRIISAPLQPGGLLLEGSQLLTLGRLGDGTLALARFRAADLAFLGMDTLSGFAWDGVLPRSRSPRLIYRSGSYYAVDGNAPNAQGRLLRIDKENGKVTATRDIPEGSAVDLIRIGERIYVGSGAPAARRVKGFDFDLAPVDSLDMGGPIERMAGDRAGAFAAYGFALAGNSVLAFVPRAREPIGSLAVPTPGEAHWIAVDGPTRTVLVSDGKNLFTAAFRPE